ncbi:hypothetical protein H6G06_20220 [Anabaena sphaerica FACHB-251]|uniref:Uncharacterized protein n=1 Tax=Anabaena sphaerica FACHB-251 TaxID=2692883 RepID=A0A926WJU3_9NOST|nr:hypothetical protein [Anabaena sphaerica]MBD2295737.1 hypothetical protein [Anabaena sphaerica FACHB-251]
MGRWTPLILMAGGVAILLGTLLGINFPMGGQQTANVPPGRRASSVLPANINVNSTATRDDAEAATRNNSETSTRNNSETSTRNNSQTTNRNDFADDTRRTSVAQSNATTESTGTTDSTQGSNTTDTSTSTTDTSSSSGDINQDKEPIRALW